MTTNERRKQVREEALLSDLPEALRLYSPRQVARILQIDAAAVRRLVRLGKLEARRVGFQIRVPQPALEKYLDENALRGTIPKGVRGRRGRS